MDKNQVLKKDENGVPLDFPYRKELEVYKKTTQECMDAGMSYAETKIYTKHEIRRLYPYLLSFVPGSESKEARFWRYVAVWKSANYRNPYRLISSRHAGHNQKKKEVRPKIVVKYEPEVSAIDPLVPEPIKKNGHLSYLSSVRKAADAGFVPFEKFLQPFMSVEYSHHYQRKIISILSEKEGYVFLENAFGYITTQKPFTEPPEITAARKLLEEYEKKANLEKRKQPAHGK